MIQATSGATDGLDAPSELAIDAGTEAALAPAVPRAVVRRDWVLPIFIIASLIVHATILLPSLFNRSAEQAAAPREIPVEIVQLPPDPPKPPPPPKVAQKPPPPKVAPKPPQKPAAPSVAERMKQLLGPMPAVALPGASMDGTDDVSYTQLVLSKVAKAKREGRYKGVPGATSVAFTLSDSGDVSSVMIIRPSGDKTLDDEAIAMVKRGAPYPPPPPGGRRDYAITLRFQPLI